MCLFALGSIPDWFNVAVHFLSGSGSSHICFLLPLNVDLSNVLESCEFDVVCNCLLEVDSNCLSVFTDGSLYGLDTLDMEAGTAVFFENIDLGLGVEVFGLVSFIMTELQAIALALECVPSSHSVNLFSDSQAALDACKSELMLGCPDFRNQCWIKVRGHSGVLGNKHADTLARTTASSGVHLPHRINEHFLKAGGTVVSGNSRHFVRDVFRSIHRVHWEVSSGSWTLHHHLSVAVQKHLYDKGYPSVMCLFCDNVEISDHVFSCPFDAGDHARLINAHASVWKTCSGLSHSTLCVSQSLSACTSNAVVGAAICKGFVFNEWYRESFSVFKDFKTVAQNIVAFVRDFCLVFCDDIWLVHAKHRAVMEKGGLIPHDGSIPVSVSGLLSVLSSNVVRLLGIANAIGIGFRFHRSSLFFLGIGNLVSVHIGA
ncbi:hypothetical protein G9A89_007007 [Geosiphon pyriformis]|nr:hypothetical protein G9A89_007007 [Geosiphon pyriformis]